MRRKEVYSDAGAARAVGWMAAKRAARPGVLWGFVFGATIEATMASYKSAFPTAASRASLVATLQGNAAFEALFGPLRHMDTVAGYVAYKASMTVIVIGAIWGLFIATKLLRGEEESGRWELLLAGQTTRADATVQALLGIGAGAVALWVPTTLLAVAGGAGKGVGIGAGTCVFFATALVSAVVMFMAVGALTSQLAPTRHEANLYGAGVLTASYLIRMAADSATGIHWLRWASPIGWIEEAQPLIGSRAYAFIPIVIATGMLVAASVRVAAARDAGAATFSDHDAAPARTMLLGGQAGLTLRLTRPTIISWLAALGVTGLIFGLVTQAAGRSLKSSPTIARVIARLGATGAGAVTYLGFVFLISAGLVGVAVAGQISAIRNEESGGHLDNLLVLPVSRWRWLAVRVAVGLGLVLGASVMTGVAAWIGAVTQHAAVGFWSLIEAGINVAPPAVFVLGIGVLMFGVLPRAAIGATYGLVVWSFLVETFAGVSKTSHWLKDTSPFLHTTPAPAAPPDWVAAAWLTGLGLLCVAAGVGAFARRDLVGA